MPLGRDQIPILLPGRQHNTLRSGQRHHLRIRRPVRRRNDRHVPYPTGSQYPLVHALLRAVPHDDLRIRVVGDTFPVGEIGGDGPAEGRRAGYGGVAGLVVGDGGYGGVEDRFGGGEVGFADAEGCYLYSFGLHFFDEGEDFYGGGWFDG